MLKEVADYDDFDRVMGTDLVWTCWANVHPDDPRLLTLMVDNPDLRSEDIRKLVPLYIHGDHVQFVNDDSTKVWHMASIYTTTSSIFSGLLLVACPKRVEVKSTQGKEGTWDPVWRGHWLPSFTSCPSGKLWMVSPYTQVVGGCAYGW